MSTRTVAGALAIAYAMLSAVPANAQLSSSRRPDLLVSEGHALYDAGRYKEAAASFERAMQLGVDRPGEAALEVARSYARLGNRKQALRWGELATRFASLNDGGPREAARALPSIRRAPGIDALISRLEEVQWQTRPAGTPTARSRSSGSSTTSTI